MEEIDPTHFMEALLSSILSVQGITHETVGIYDKKMKIDNWPAVVCSVASLCRYISLGYAEHLRGVVSFLNTTGISVSYIEALSKQLFDGKEFSWRSFRMFLALICQLSVVALRGKMTFLSDELMFNTAVHIRDKLGEPIGGRWCWTAFALDCVRIVLKAKELEVVTRAVSVISVQPTSSTTTTQMKDPVCSTFNNQTFGRCYVVDTKENVPDLEDTPRGRLRKKWLRRAADNVVHKSSVDAQVKDAIEVSQEVMKLVRH